MYEFSTVMAVAAVLAANFYNGLNTYSWNWWVLAGVLIGPVLIILYTAVYSAFPPTLIWTYVWGNNHFLWPSAYWWLGLVFTIILSLGPRYLYRAIKEAYFPDDVDILRAMEKRDPQHDWAHDPMMPHQPDGAHFEPLAPTPDSASASSPMIARRTVSRTSSRRPLPQRDSYQLGRARTHQSLTHDMSTGLARVGTGSGYAFDEGVGLNLERYTSRGSQASRQNRPRKGSVRLGKVELNRASDSRGSLLSIDWLTRSDLPCCSLRSQVGQDARPLVVVRRPPFPPRQPQVDCPRGRARAERLGAARADCAADRGRCTERAPDAAQGHRQRRPRSLIPFSSLPSSFESCSFRPA